MSKNIKEMVEEIQFRMNLTLDQIAERIGYTRPYLSDAIKKNNSIKLYKKLLFVFQDVITPEGHTVEKIAAQEAAIRVLLEEMITLRHLVTKEPTEKIALYLADKIKQAVILRMV